MGKSISPLVKRLVPGMTYRITALPGTHGCILSLHSHTRFLKINLLRDAPKPRSKQGLHSLETQHSREEIKPQLRIPPPATAVPGHLHHPPASSTHKAKVYFVCFPNFSAANQASWKEKKQKTEGRRKGAGGWELTLCGQAVHLHEMLILPRQGQS